MMNYYKKIVLLGISLFLLIMNNQAFAQSDSLLYRELDLKRIGLNYYNFSKLDKFNFEVVVLGGVRNPGIYLLSEGMSLIELVALSGGATDESIFDNIKLIRAKNKNPNLKSDTVMIISYKDIFDREKTGSINKQNPLLMPGDIISFPIKPDKDFWDYATRIATIFVLPLLTITTLILQIMNYNK